MSPSPFSLFPELLIAEVLFSILAVFFCWIIYYKTKESYELSKHQGLRYFRGAFLFFGLSYFIRFLIAVTILSAFTFDIFIPRYLMMHLFMLVVGYCSTMGIFYLLFSTFWKRVENKIVLPLAYGAAVLLSIVSLLMRSYVTLLLLQSLLLILLLVVTLVKGKGKKMATKVLYGLIAILWLINVWIIQNPFRLYFGVRIFFEVVSLLVFIAIYYKVAKWVQ